MSGNIEQIKVPQEDIPFQPEAAAALYRMENEQLSEDLNNLPEGSGQRRKLMIAVAGLTLGTFLSGAMVQEAEARARAGGHHHGGQHQKVSPGKIVAAVGLGMLGAGLNDWRKDQDARRRIAVEDARAERQMAIEDARANRDTARMLIKAGIQADQESVKFYRDMQRQGLKHDQIMEKMELQHNQKIEGKQVDSRIKRSERADRSASEAQRDTRKDKSYEKRKKIDYELKQGGADKDLKRKQDDREHKYVVDEWKAGGKQERDKDKAKFKSGLGLEEDQFRQGLKQQGAEKQQELKRQEKGDQFHRQQKEKMYSLKLKQMNELFGRLRVAKDDQERKRIMHDYQTVKKELEELKQELSGARIM